MNFNGETGKFILDSARQASPRLDHTPSPSPTKPATPVGSSNAAASEETSLLSRSRLQALVRETDPSEQLDEDVEDMLLVLADQFVEEAVVAACKLAKHRKANTIEPRDVMLPLERHWNGWLPGCAGDEIRPARRNPVVEAHRQRLSLMRKAMKKY